MYPHRIHKEREAWRDWGMHPDDVVGAASLPPSFLVSILRHCCHTACQAVSGVTSREEKASGWHLQTTGQWDGFTFPRKPYQPGFPALAHSGLQSKQIQSQSHSLPLSLLLSLPLSHPSSCTPILPPIFPRERERDITAESVPQRRTTTGFNRLSGVAGPHLCRERDAGAVP